MARIQARARFSPDGRHAIYRADPRGDGVHELHHVALARPGRAEPLSRPGDNVQSFQVGPERVVYANLASGAELLPVPLAGGVPPLPFGGGLATSGEYSVSSDGAWTVFHGDAELDGRYELWSAPTDGHAPSVRLAPDASGPDFHGYALSPLSDVVAFVADQDGDGDPELAVAPLAGGVPRVLANSVTGFEPREVEFDPSGARLLFRFVSGGRTVLRSIAAPNGLSAVTVNEPLQRRQRARAPLHAERRARRVPRRRLDRRRVPGVPLADDRRRPCAGAPRRSQPISA